MIKTFFIVNARIADIMRDEGITVSPPIFADLVSDEVGKIEDGFLFIESCPYEGAERVPTPPKQITYGPQRKGRGGKIKRW
jgi:hypothetical protein